MAKIARCGQCGHLMSEVWKERTECEKCSSPVEHVVEDLGFSDRMPRIFNMGGMTLGSLAVLLLIYNIATEAMGRSEGATIIVLFALGILFFIISLMVQFQLSSIAKERTLQKVVSRSQKRIKRTQGERNNKIRSGPVERGECAKASKILVGKK